MKRRQEGKSAGAEEGEAEGSRQARLDAAETGEDDELPF